MPEHGALAVQAAAAMRKELDAGATMEEAALVPEVADFVDGLRKALAVKIEMHEAVRDGMVYLVGPQAREAEVEVSCDPDGEVKYFVKLPRPTNVVVIPFVVRPVRLWEMPSGAPRWGTSPARTFRRRRDALRAVRRGRAWR